MEHTEVVAVKLATKLNANTKESLYEALLYSLTNRTNVILNTGGQVYTINFDDFFSCANRTD